MAIASSTKIISALLLATVPGSLSKKPVKQFLWTADAIGKDLRAFLDGVQVQVDQSGSPSHAVNLVAPFPGATCVGASQAEVNACLTNCHKNDIGQPTLLKQCTDGCHALQDCNNQCGAHSTANYVRYGFEMMLAVNQSCEPNRSSPDVNGTDLTNLIPNPLAMGCHLTKFSISLSDDITQSNVVPGKGIHLNVKAEADDPTLRCGGIIGNPTFHHSNFDIYFNPSVTSHKVNWATTATFDVDVGWWLDGIYQLNHKVKTAINGFMATALGKPEVALDINKALTILLARDIKSATGDEVDDFLTISASDATGILVTFNPLCGDGSADCSCSTSCNGLHFCDPQYWNASASAPPCPSHQKCLSTGVCCAPSCKAGSCGSDGCGGTCSTCPFGQACHNNVCTNCALDQNCHKNHCSPNACGIYCGTCGTGSTLVCDPSEGCILSGNGPAGKPPRALLASK